MLIINQQEGVELINYIQYTHNIEVGVCNKLCDSLVCYQNIVSKIYFTLSTFLKNIYYVDCSYLLLTASTK